MTTYYRCDGSVSDSIEPTAKQCSTGWLVVDEPTFHLVTREQADAFISAFLGLIAVVIVFRIIYKVLN